MSDAVSNAYAGKPPVPRFTCPREFSRLPPNLVGVLMFFG